MFISAYMADKEFTLERPRLRYVEPMPIEHEGQQMIVIRDPFEIANSPILLSMDNVYLVNLFDGEHTRAEIEATVIADSGTELPEGVLDDLIAQLDDNYFLHSPRFREHYRALCDAWATAPVREAAHAGQSYPAEPEALKAVLDGFYAEAKQDLEAPPGPIRAILAPHIDLRSGGACYAPAFELLKRHSDADLFVIFGVDHYGEGVPYNVCSKDFSTPLGRVETDRELVGAWEAEAGPLTRADWSHRTEHSIEFPVLFLQHAFDRPFKILPVLCGPMEPFMESNTSPGAHPDTRALLASLEAAIEGLGRKAVYVLSVDLAHMGPKFGDEHPIDDEALRRIEALDRALLEPVAAMDAAGFLNLLREDMNRRKVDAPMAVLSWMSMNQARCGRLLDYGQNFQPDTGSMVSFASMVFWE
jgi:AmmeMemoRadiSam system protein B